MSERQAFKNARQGNATLVQQRVLLSDVTKVFRVTQYICEKTNSISVSFSANFAQNCHNTLHQFHQWYFCYNINIRTVIFLCLWTASLTWLNCFMVHFDRATCKMLNILRCRIFGFCVLWFPQNERKIYRPRQLSLLLQNTFFCKSKHIWLCHKNIQTETKYSAP